MKTRDHSIWRYVFWNLLRESPELVQIQNPVVKRDHVKKEIVAARFYEISAEEVQQAARLNESS